MVEQEVKKKTRVYSTVAILGAMILVSLIFAFGSTPGLMPTSPSNSGNPGATPSTTSPGTSPETTNNPGTTNPGTNPTINPGEDATVIPAELVSPLKQFQSQDELKNYLTAKAATNNVFGGSLLDRQATDSFSGATPQTPQTASPTTGAGSTYYSTTNIQVAGVDEADITKNDGQFIYTASNTYTGQNFVYIVKADPNDPHVVAKIPLDNYTYLAGMFLSADHSQLVVIGSQYRYYLLDARAPTASPTLGIAIAPNYYSDVQTFLYIYNVADKTHITLVNNFTLSGSYFNSRMIGDFVYTIVSQSAFIYNNIIPLPKITTTATTTEIPATSIYYVDNANFTDSPYNYFTFTSFYGINLKDPTQLTNMTVLMGGASNMYVSLGNIYVTYPTWTTTTGSITSIYRVSIDNGKLTLQAKGGVIGNVLNQYSMDEYNGYFRLATTNWKNTTQNTVYVLNMNLETVGKLELQNTEIRETIQSARFIGNKAYIVTFQQKDPFFVLDMSNPNEPKIAGKLEIPGFSSYLHPYDENHIIGLGMENSTVKLSLFDVTNVNAPQETAKYNVQGDYSYSQAQYDPKAFLFDLSKQLLVIPISVTTYGTVSGNGTAPTYQASYWDGVYVFRLTLGGFELRGKITQQNTTATTTYYGGDYNLRINRSLYIDNTLYTVSNSEVKLNSLTSIPDLAPIAEVPLK